jgi:hypothetical protein
MITFLGWSSESGMLTGKQRKEETDTRRNLHGEQLLTRMCLSSCCQSSPSKYISSSDINGENSVLLPRICVILRGSDLSVLVYGRTAEAETVDIYTLPRSDNVSMPSRSQSLLDCRAKSVASLLHSSGSGMHLPGVPDNIPPAASCSILQIPTFFA